MYKSSNIFKESLPGNVVETVVKMWSKKCEILDCHMQIVKGTLKCFWSMGKHTVKKSTNEDVKWNYVHIHYDRSTNHQSLTLLTNFRSQYPDQSINIEKIAWHKLLLKQSPVQVELIWTLSHTERMQCNACLSIILQSNKC